MTKNLEEYPKIHMYRRIVQAKLFIDRHYEEKIDVDNIADEACFSKFYFIRLFKKAYGKTPHQYLTAIRIDKALQLLSTDKSVSEVCFAVGFESLSSFSGLFKHTVGMTPSAYLTKQRQIKAQISQTPLKFVPGCYAYQYGWSEKAILEK